jgi:hypothetical protein
MSAILMNRAGFAVPEDGFYHLAPLGEFAHAQAGVLQIIDQEACAAMVNNFRQDAEAANFAGILVDFDHFSLDGERRSEAAGWIVALECRGARGEERGAEENSTTKGTKNAKAGEDGAGLWAKIRWSDLGEEAVKGGRYRFLSPVWGRGDCTDLGDGRLRPLRLLNAAVTNDPNLKGMAPLSNSTKPASDDLGRVAFHRDRLSSTDHRSLLTALPPPPDSGLLTPDSASSRPQAQIANIGWQDEARTAALAVRKAKAAARGSTAPVAPGEKPEASSNGKGDSRGGAKIAEGVDTAAPAPAPQPELRSEAGSLREILARIRKLRGLVAQKAALRATKRVTDSRATPAPASQQP